MLLLGHRGCRGEFTENTFAAFDHALSCGCDGFEFDVRLTNDAVPIVWHDARLRGRFISRHSFGSLRERCLLARRRSVDLCELEAVLARYAQLAWMDIELKVPGVEQQVVALLRRYPPTRGFVVSSFHRRVLLEMHRLAPELPLGFIFKRMPPGRPWRTLPIRYVMPQVKLLTLARVRQFHDEGLQVITWTVNQLSVIRSLQQVGVDGIIGDDPRLLANVR